MKLSPQEEEHRVELAVGNLLRWGVLTAAAITAIGGIVLLLAHGSEPVLLGTFHGEPAGLATLDGIVRGAFAGDGGAIVQLGVVVLIATPVLRVAFTLVAFLYERDHLYTAVTALVLAILLFSFLAGGVG